MLRPALLLLTLCLSTPAWTPAWAQELPTTQQRLTMLGSYSLALGHKFGCDSNTTKMVSDIKKYTYALQFGDGDSAAASDAAKTNLTTGINDVKSHKVGCDGVDKEVTDIENTLRSDHPMMEQAMKTVAVVAGAAGACNVPKESVEQGIAPAAAYTRMSGEADKAAMAKWMKEGADEVTSKKTECDEAQAIFEQIKDMFAP